MNPNTKVYRNGVRDMRYGPRDKAGKFTMKNKVRSMWNTFIHRMKILAIISFTLFIAGSIGAVAFSTSTVQYAIADAPQTQAAVLVRIADCESGNGVKGAGHQFNKDGSIVSHTNNNGTVDVGKYQINMNASNIKLLSKLGLNPLTEEGNSTFAKYLYENVGTGPWSSSAHCWLK